MDEEALLGVKVAGGKWQFFDQFDKQYGAFSRMVPKSVATYYYQAKQ